MRTSQEYDEEVCGRLWNKVHRRIERVRNDAVLQWVEGADIGLLPCSVVSSDGRSQTPAQQKNKNHGVSFTLALWNMNPQISLQYSSPSCRIKLNGNFLIKSHAQYFYSNPISATPSHVHWEEEKIIISDAQLHVFLTDF
jgi:hypothetical protein